MKPYKKHRKCIFFAEQVREFVNPKYKESSHTTGQTVRQLVIDWEKLRRRWLCFCVKYEKGKSENEANHQSSVKRAAGGLCLCIENMSTAAEGLCHSIGIQKSQVDNEMKRKEIFKKKEAGGQLCLSFDQKSGRSLL